MSKFIFTYFDSYGLLFDVAPFLAWLPLQSPAVKTTFFVQILDGEELFREVPVKFVFKWPERGQKLFGHVSDRFSDPFSLFIKTFFVSS